MKFIRTLLVIALAPAASRADDLPAYPSGMFAELPHERAELHDGFRGVSFPVTTPDEMASKFFQQGLAELYAGSATEAVRAFREVITRDPNCAMGYWGIAKAIKDDASRSVEFMWYAHQRRRKASKLEQELIEAYAAHIGASTEPTMILVDSETGKRRARTDGLHRTSSTSFRKALGKIAKQHSDVPDAQALFALESPVQSAPGAAFLEAGYQHPLRPALDASERVSRFTIGEAMQQRLLQKAWYATAVAFSRKGQLSDATTAIEARVRLDNAWLQKHDAMPYERERFFMHRNQLAIMPMDAQSRAKVMEIFQRTPLHPGRAIQQTARFKREIPKQLPPKVMTPGQQRAIASLGPLTWTPPKAPDFLLPRGQQPGVLGTAQFERPTLVVFYLGFGCIHCVEQLNELRPKYDEFKAAGIDIVAIGTDKVDEVKAAVLDAIEVDAPETQFPILCDPKGNVFKQFHCWDEFTDEPLHGTFLIDSAGRIRWRDISREPFMQTEFLLNECKRLIALKDN